MSINLFLIGTEPILMKLLVQVHNFVRLSKLGPMCPANVRKYEVFFENLNFLRIFQYLIGNSSRPTSPFLVSRAAPSQSEFETPAFDDLVLEFRDQSIALSLSLYRTQKVTWSLGPLNVKKAKINYFPKKCIQFHPKNCNTSVANQLQPISTTEH